MQISYAVRRSTLKGAGKGLFALQNIPKGTMVWKWFDENHRFHDNKEELLETLDKFETRQEKFDYLVYCYGYNGRVVHEYDDGHFYNHSTAANCAPDESRDVGVFANTYALRDIEKDEELLVDYDKEGYLTYPDWFYKIMDEYGVPRDTHFEGPLQNTN